MGNDLLSGFSLSWARLGTESCDRTIQHDRLKKFPQLQQRLVEMKTRILNASDLSAESENITKDLRESTSDFVMSIRTHPDSALVEASPEASKAIDELFLAVEFLKDFFALQVHRLKERLEAKKQYAPLPESDFLKAHPQYERGQVFSRWILQHFHRSSRQLSAEMGFPVIQDYQDEREVKAKVRVELLRIYNERNGYSPENVTYKPGSELPQIKDFLYPDRALACFGGFRGAVRAVILQGENVLEDHSKPSTVEMVPEELARILELSMTLGRKPTSEEAGLDNFEGSMAAVKCALIKDLQDGIQKATVSMQSNQKNPDQRYQRFRWKFLFLACPLFATYGVRVFDFFLDAQDFDRVLSHSNRGVEQKLRQVFLGKKKLSAMRNAPRLFRITDREIDDLEAMPQEEAIARIETTIIRRKFFASARLWVRPMARVLRIYVDQGITVPPGVTHLLHGSQSRIQRMLHLLAEKAAYFRSHPKIPLYMRQILFGMTKTTVSNIEERAAVYADAGNDEQHFCHFLHEANSVPQHAKELCVVVRNFGRITGWILEQASHLPKTIQRSSGVAARIHALLAEHLHTADIPPLAELEGLYFDQIQQRIASALELGEPITPEILKPHGVARTQALHSKRKQERNADACKQLEALGYPYAELCRTRRLLSPENILPKVELMVQVFGRVRAGLLNRSEEHILAVADEEREEKPLAEEQGIVQSFLLGIGCDEETSDLLARSGESLPVMRKKVDVFRRCPLNPDTAGKSRLELHDYAPFLSLSLRYCQQFGTRVLRNRLEKTYAIQQLREAFGIDWDHEKGWIKSRGLREISLSVAKPLVHDLEANPQYVILRLGVRQQVLKRHLHILYELRKMLLQVQKTSSIVEAVQQATGGNHMLQQESLDLGTPLSDSVLKLYQRVVGETFRPASGRFFSEEEERRLLQLKDSGTPEEQGKAVEALIVVNQPLVASIAGRFGWSGIPHEDLVQEGNLGFMRAIKKFDPKRGARLSTYAIIWIRQFMRRYILDNGRHVRIPEHVQDEMKRYQTAVDDYFTTHGQRPDFTSIADQLGLSPEHRERLQTALTTSQRKVLSLDWSQDDGGESFGSTVAGTESSHRTDIPDQDHAELIVFLREAYRRHHPANSSKRDVEFFLFRYGFKKLPRKKEGGIPTHKEIGDYYHIGRETVRQREARVLDFFRQQPEIIERLREFL